MLIYNFQKEFLGIDEKDLKTLGFNSLADLRAEVTDFADLFVKTPGYIHNFKHVHWIDFINYADVSEESKVLINVNSKTFKATLSVSNLFLIDNPNSPAYMIHLHNLRPLSKSENNDLSSDVLDRELPEVKPQEPKVFTPAPEVAPAVHDNYDTNPQPQVQQYPEPEEIISIDIEDTHTQEESPIETLYTEPQTLIEEPITQEVETPTALDVEDLSLDVFEDETAPEISESADREQTTAKKVVKKEVVQEEWDNGYQYDPHIASKELGLPLDLIEEFIQDFIAQAKEFKPNIYASIEEGDVDNVKTLSHKLKGVAANLRIEDAHEVLSAVSATQDMAIIEENLNIFYKIIAKLAGEPVKEVIVVEEEVEEGETLDLDFKDDNNNDEVITVNDTETTTEDEDLLLSFKDDDTEETLTISDEDVPEKIEIPELADDEFLNIELDEEDYENNELDTSVKTSHFSKAQAAKEIGIDEESFNELFDDFMQESKNIIQTIRTALENDDEQSCRDEALKLQGMSENMRFNEFNESLEVLINSLDKDEKLQAVEQLDSTISQISNMGA